MAQDEVTPRDPALTGAFKRNRHVTLSHLSAGGVPRGGPAHPLPLSPRRFPLRACAQGRAVGSRTKNGGRDGCGHP